MATAQYRSISKNSAPLRANITLLIVATFFIVYGAPVRAETSVGAELAPPNIILILTDDQGWGDLGHHGNIKIDTPNMDSIARQGVSFERFYVNPVCAPTRASLLTGRYSLRTGVHNVTRGEDTIRAAETTLAEALKSAGYATGAFGKWHSGAHFPHTANGQGFDEFFGFNAGHISQYFDAELEHNKDKVRTKGFITDVITDAALAFIEANKDRPFLAYIPYNAPHSPYQIADSYFDKYKTRGLSDRTASIYGMVENIDDNIGRVLERIQELKLNDNTIVVFLSDNGPHGERYNGGMRAGKGSVHEGGVRVPLFIHWPGQIEGGKVIHQIAQHIDLYPTLLALAGVEVPAELQLLKIDGIDLSPLLHGIEAEFSERLLYSHKFSMGPVLAQPGAVRSQQWLAVFENDAWSLYDIVNDTGEQKNLAREHPEQLEQLIDAYQNWFTDVTSDGFEAIPIQLGHEGYPVVELPAPEAYLLGENISYAGGNGWAHSWITGWKGLDSYAYWNIDVVTGGDYEVQLEYALPTQDRGARLSIDISGRSLEEIIDAPHSRLELNAPDRAPRYSVFDQTWAVKTLGKIRLDQGAHRVQLHALAIPGKEAPEIKLLRFRQLK